MQKTQACDWSDHSVKAKFVGISDSPGSNEMSVSILIDMSPFNGPRSAPDTSLCPHVVSTEVEVRGYEQKTESSFES